MESVEEGYAQRLDGTPARCIYAVSRLGIEAFVV